MKKIIYLMAIMMVLASISVAAKPEIRASILRYEPTPAEQGNTFDVWVQLSNEGTKAEKVALKFVPEYPFSLPGEETGYVDIGELSSTEDYVEKVTIYTDVNAPNGDRTIKFWYKYESENWIQLDGTITLQTQNAAIIVKEYTVSPEQVMPGQEAVVTMTLQNNGAIGVKNVDVQLDLGEDFSTLGTGSVQRIRSIAPGREEQVSFRIASDTNTEVKLYNIPVEIDYMDTRNKEYETTAKISMKMNAEPEIYMIVDETEFPAEKAPGKVGLQVINKGIVNIKYTTVTLLPADEYEILSPSTLEYVGNLDNDDFETVEFMIKPNKENPTLDVKLEFKDPYNVDFTRDYKLPVKIFTAQELGKGGFPWGTMVVLLISAGIAVYFWRRHKKKSKK